MTRAEGRTIWLTGLSGTGKSTVAALLAPRLRALGRRVEVLDGDVVRAQLGAGLGFGRADRDANVSRIGWVAGLLNRHGVDVVVAAIAPYRDTRDAVLARLPGALEVFMTASLGTLIARDVKGLYRRAIAGEIPNFTGISDPYEPPLAPAVVCRSDGSETPEESAARILDAFLAPSGRAAS